MEEEQEETLLDLTGLEIEEIAMALADQTDYDHRWLINPRSGRLVLWTSDTGIDGENPVDLEDLDLIPIDPVPSYVWYQDMVDFADGISDERTGERLARTLRGPGAFRRFKNEIYKHPHLISPWQSLREARAADEPSSGSSTRSSLPQKPPKNTATTTPTRAFREPHDLRADPTRANPHPESTAG